MKVLIVGQLPVEAGGTYTTGVCNVVYELSKCATEDVELIIYATNMNDNAKRNVGNSVYRGTKLNPFNSLLHLSIHPIETAKEWSFYKKKCFASPLRYDAYRYNIERIIEEEKPDVIHCMSVFQIASCYFANKRRKLPLILTLHGVDFDAKSQDRVGVEIADVVTGLTPETMKGILSLGASENKIVMVPNGTDTSKFFFSEDARAMLRKDLGVEEKTTIMLTIGSLSHRKGQLSFLSKLRDLPKDFNYLYLIIGKGEDEVKIQSYIKDNNMQDCVKVIGYVKNTELYRYHSAADVYVHSSRWEGQALSEVEAYATDLKTAVNREIIGTVITDTDNIDDYWVFDFDSFDRDTFVSWASNHKKNRRTRRIYDWNRIFEMYCNIYKRLIQ